MKNIVILLLLCGAAFSQATPPPPAPPVSTFSFNATALSLPGNHQTVAGTDAGVAVTVTKNLDLRQDNILAPTSGFQFFGAGFNYRLPVISTKLDNISPTLPGLRFQFYITAQVGVDRIQGPTSTAQHYAFLAGGGVNYDVSGSGKWTMGGEVRYAKFPGLQNNTWVAALGPAIHF